MNLARDVTLAILAGGEGRRMGKSKGMLTIAGRPILEYLIDRFDWPGPTMLVTAPGREHPPGCERFDREVVDAVAGEGPLRGVLTALENATTPIVLVTTVDMPRVEQAQLEWLGAKFDARPPAAGMLLRRDGKNIEPFPSIFRFDVRVIVRRRLDSRQMAMHKLAEEAAIETIDVPAEWDPSVWTNLNSPADLDRL